MMIAERRKSETILGESKNPIRQLTVAELEAVSGGDGGGGPTCPPPPALCTDIGDAGIGIDGQ